ncbi:MTRF1L release factor glutamine methyltransferase-like [Dipodomys spectabilis]|uniref:MTRF1L release factor glutamine methyltransferase-like n=1 Tax=Dipodomys spectabilis TaxID=105255 RepID=UPI001C53B7E3|nr:MTRF1L release factor glutamine methyltransferase-like [Dipodomys spectabilis]
MDGFREEDLWQRAEAAGATELVSGWTAVFEKIGFPEALESSEYTMAHILATKTFQSLKTIRRSKPLSPQQLHDIQDLSGRQLQRMPVQYILGYWNFCWLNLKITPPVFIPRVETEELVEWVLEEVAQHPHVAGTQGGPLILKVGCGSGVVLLSLLKQLHESQVIAVDKNEASIRLTQNNAQRLRLQDRIRIIPLDVTFEGSWTLLLPWAPVDPVISNPPNVFHRDMEQLDPEILRGKCLDLPFQQQALRCSCRVKRGEWVEMMTSFCVSLAVLKTRPRASGLQVNKQWIESPFSRDEIFMKSAQRTLQFPLLFYFHAVHRAHEQMLEGTGMPDSPPFKRVKKDEHSGRGPVPQQKALQGSEHHPK